MSALEEQMRYARQHLTFDAGDRSYFWDRVARAREWSRVPFDLIVYEWPTDCRRVSMILGHGGRSWTTIDITPTVQEFASSQAAKAYMEQAIEIVVRSWIHYHYSNLWC